MGERRWPAVAPVCMCDERGRMSRLPCPACDYDDEDDELEQEGADDD